MGISRLPRHILNESISDSLIIDNIVLHSSTDTIYFKDVNSVFLLHNGAHLHHFKVKDPNDLVGKSDFDYFPEEEAKLKREDEIQIMKTGVPLRDKIEEGMNADGERIYFAVSKYPLYDYEGTIIGTWGTSRDVTQMIIAEQQLAQANKRLTELSIIDNVTGLYNQRHFYSNLEITIKRYTRKKFSNKDDNFCLVFLDVDHFKTVNDNYGHLIGDSALSHIASILKSHTRSTDMIFRYGGDEYAVILLDCNLESGRIYAENLRKQIEQTPLLTDKDKIFLTMSIGVVEFQNEEKSSDLVSKSDCQLYKAKTDGRNLVR